MAPRPPALGEASEELGSSMAALRLKGTELLDQISEQFEQCKLNLSASLQCVHELFTAFQV
eukprot:18756-Heterococcus_DN1.PRE.3